MAANRITKMIMKTTTPLAAVGCFVIA